MVVIPTMWFSFISSIVCFFLLCWISFISCITCKTVLLFLNTWRLGCYLMHLFAVLVSYNFLCVLLLSVFWFSLCIVSYLFLNLFSLILKIYIIIIIIIIIMFCLCLFTLLCICQPSCCALYELPIS
jgi:hypothetical protein